MDDESPFAAKGYWKHKCEICSKVMKQKGEFWRYCRVKYCEVNFFEKGELHFCPHETTEGSSGQSNNLWNQLRESQPNLWLRNNHFCHECDQYLVTWVPQLYDVVMTNYSMNQLEKAIRDVKRSRKEKDTNNRRFA